MTTVASARCSRYSLIIMALTVSCDQSALGARGVTEAMECVRDCSLQTPTTFVACTMCGSTTCLNISSSWQRITHVLRAAICDSDVAFQTW